MDSILVKIFATAFTLSEILTHPASVKTHLDPIADQDEVVRIALGRESAFGLAPQCLGQPNP